MRVLYVLDRPELGGGVKVVFEHAQWLTRFAGWDVTVAARGPKPKWVDFGGRFVDWERTALPARSVDLVVATYWTTLEPARRLDVGPLAHFCQGYELDHLWLSDRWPRIEATYAAGNEPFIVVSPHLGVRLESRYGRPWALAPPHNGVAPREPTRQAPRRRPWIVVPGTFEAACKGVEIGLRAFLEIRAAGVPARLLRVTTLKLGPEEVRLVRADRVLCGVRPGRVINAFRSADLMIFPALEGEGFGLPLLEAMATGLPAVAHRIGPVEYMSAGALPLSPPGRPDELGRSALSLLTDAERWRGVRDAGLRRSRCFAPARTGPELRAALEWARTGRAGAEPRRKDAVVPEAGAATRMAAEPPDHQRARS